jgi:hypothetical protein
MALYTTPPVALARLRRYAGLEVPETVADAGTGTSAMDDLIAEASSLIEGFIGYAWESKAYSETAPMSRDGQAKLLIPDSLFCPMTALTSIGVSGNAQYFGPAILTSNTEWSADGVIVLAYPVVYSPQRWVNPIPLGRSAGYNAALKLYPDEIAVSYVAGPTTAPPEVFLPVCIRVMAILIGLRDDLDALLSKKQKTEDLGTTTDYRDDPIADAMRPLSRWTR